MVVKIAPADEGYSTISVPPSVKRTLQKAKGEKEWGEYLMELYAENVRLRQERAHGQLRELLTGEDLESIEGVSREFRRSFRIGGKGDL